MIDPDKRAVGAWWIWGLFLLLLSSFAFMGLKAAGLIGSTIVERVVFENSYQKHAGDKAKRRTFEAQKAAIQTQLRRSDLTAGQRADYEAQINAITIQISTVKGD